MHPTPPQTDFVSEEAYWFGSYQKTRCKHTTSRFPKRGLLETRVERRSASAMKRQWEMPAAQESKAMAKGVCRFSVCLFVREASRFPPNFVPRKMCDPANLSTFYECRDMQFVVCFEALTCRTAASARRGTPAPLPTLRKSWPLAQGLKRRAPWQRQLKACACGVCHLTNTKARRQNLRICKRSMTCWPEKLLGAFGLHNALLASPKPCMMRSLECGFPQSRSSCIENQSTNFLGQAGMRTDLRDDGAVRSEKGSVHNFNPCCTCNPVLPGSLDAPRMFHGDIRPTALCKMWIQHPTYCTHGDGCTFAHGSRAHLKDAAEYPTESGRAFSVCNSASRGKVWRRCRQTCRRASRGLRSQVGGSFAGKGSCLSRLHWLDQRLARNEGRCG